MKIAFWHFYSLRMLRGIETLAISLANVLAERNHDVSLITAKPTISPLVCPNPRVGVYAYPTSRFYEHQAIVPFYVYHLWRYKYDHVIAFFSDFGEGAALDVLSKFTNVPMSLYLCYPYSSVPHRYHSFLRHGWGQKARHILADANWIAREAQELFHRPVPVVPVGTDPQRFRQDPERRNALRDKMGYRENDVVLLNVSSLEARKGTWRVIQALSRLRTRIPNLRYFILGAGEDEPRLKKMVDELQLNHIVIFGGVTSELEGYYNMADIFVMLPDGEGNSVACHEAMSCALPVVVSDSGGFLESVPPEAGALVDLQHPASVDEALTQIAANASLRVAMGAAGRRHVLANYTWEHIADRFLEVVA